MKIELHDLIKSVFINESKALSRLTSIVNNDLINIINLIHQSQGKLILTGIGKSALIAAKISSSLNSIGVTSVFMHATDALHGDLGVIDSHDIILCFSKSGQSPEIKALISHLKDFSVTIIAVTCNAESDLARQADYLVHLPIEKEADPQDLIPTTSAIVQLAFGHALTIALLELNSFSTKEFARVHPGGNLGRKLYARVGELIRLEACPQVRLDDNLRKIINEISSFRLGATAVLDKHDAVIGIITDGDLRRLLEKTTQIDNVKAQDFYSQIPKSVASDTLASEAFRMMKLNKITQLLVIDEGKYKGIIHMHDLIKEGIY